LELEPGDATLWIESKAPGVAQFLLGKLRGKTPADQHVTVPL